MLIDSDQIDIYVINRIYIVVGGGHGREAFRFPIKTLYITNSGKRHESIQSMGYILYKKDHVIILKKNSNQRSWRLY